MRERSTKGEKRLSPKPQFECREMMMSQGREEKDPSMAKSLIPNGMQKVVNLLG